MRTSDNIDFTDADAVWQFIGQWHPYYNCDEIAWVDDIDKILDGEVEEGDAASQSPYMHYFPEELEKERNRLMREILTDAFENYLKENYS